MRLQIDSFGDQQIDREMLRFKGRSDNMRPVLSALADDFNDIMERQFATQGQYASGGWRPLSMRRILEKQRKGLDPRILHATHALRNSLTQRGAPGSVRRVTADELRVGTEIDYAVHHQHGTRRMPRRRPVEFRALDRRRWIKALQRFLIDGTIQT